MPCIDVSCLGGVLCVRIAINSLYRTSRDISLSLFYCICKLYMCVFAQS